MNVADTLASQAFRIWYGKYESNYPRVSYSYVVTVHEVVRALATISINYSSNAILSSGRSLLASTCKPVIALMNQTYTLLQSRLLMHYIDSFATPPSSCPYLQRSIELVPSAQTNQQGTNNQ